jgi:diguanylate cyclase (GGDEF)-like protein
MFHRDPADTGREASEKMVTQQVRGRLLGAVAVVSLALVVVLASALASCLTATSEGGHQLGGFPGPRALIVFTAMLVAGGAFVILRAAISHDQFSRRLEGLCRELESSKSRLDELSFKDEVTGLYNRRLLAMRLEDEVSRYCRFNQPLSLVLLDIDAFRPLEDELGREAGDLTLREIADILLRHSRGIDVICRSAGDEFAILLVETPKQGALLYAERIRRLVDGHAFRHGRRVTASLGVACLPEDVPPIPDDLVTTAEWALSEAKSAGKNRVAEREGAVATEAGRRGGWDL